MRVFSEEEYVQLEQEERAITDEAIVAMLFILAGLKGDLENELRSFYQKYGKDGVVTYAEARKWISEKDHQRRLTALLLFVGGVFTLALDEMERYFRKFLTEIITKESNFFGVRVDIDELLDTGWGYEELTWLERFGYDLKQWNAYTLYDIKQSLHQQKSIEEVLKKIDVRFGRMETALKRLGITESYAMGSITRHDIFKELGIKKYQFYTQADERTCETCGAMHGLTFPISSYEIGATAPPLHPNCRCFTIPIVE